MKREGRGIDVERENVFFYSWGVTLFPTTKNFVLENYVIKKRLGYDSVIFSFISQVKS